MSTQALRVGNAGKREFFRITELLFYFAMKQIKLLLQCRVPMSRQGLDEVFDHGPQTANNLQIVCATGADLGKGEMHESLPIGRAEEHAELSGGAKNLI